ncbi:MAG: hypothetical protein KAG66_02460 [Methylococcales bacterium]|nr:hypothetical protein [Methylococcales bacterium]
MATLENENPLVFQRSTERAILPEEEDDNVVDKIDDREVFGKFDVQGALICVCQSSMQCPSRLLCTVDLD